MFPPPFVIQRMRWLLLLVVALVVAASFTRMLKLEAALSKSAQTEEAET